MSIEFPEKIERPIECLENSKLFEVALNKYYEFEAGNLTKKKLDAWLMSKDGFGQEDKDSFNCDTFILMVMKYELGMSQIESFSDVEMDAYQWMDEKGGMDSELTSCYLEHVCEEYPSIEEPRMQKRAIFLDSIRNDSLKFEFDKYHNHNNDIWLWDTLPPIIMDELKKNKLSRFVFIDDNYGDYNEFDKTKSIGHAFVILGPNKSGDDMVVLEKPGPGYHLEFTTLIDVVGRSAGIWKGVLFIPKKQINTYYPENI